MKTRKSWKEKFEVAVKGLPKVVDVPPTWQKRMGGSRILVPTPKLVDTVIRKVPKGKLITAAQIRAKLAADFKADSTCPLTLGIFLRIISEYMEELRGKGQNNISPYWRVIKDDGKLNAKYPGGISSHAKLLRQEGYQITGKDDKARVADYEKSLVS
ncbi:MAG: MGMT family protein [Sedimentisphaerales bacterium]